MMPKKKPVLYTVDLSNVEKKYQWYTVVTLFNCEESVVRNVKEKVQGTDLENSICEYYIPMKIFKDEDGKIHKQKGSLSNYVFVKCLLTGKLWDALRTTSGVSVMLATGGVPTPITDEEIARMREHNKMEGFTAEEEAQYKADLKAKYYMFDPSTKDAVKEFETIQPPPTPEEIAAEEERKRLFAEKKEKEKKEKQKARAQKKKEQKAKEQKK